MWCFQPSMAVPKGMKSSCASPGPARAFARRRSRGGTRAPRHNDSSTYFGGLSTYATKVTVSVLYLYERLSGLRTWKQSLELAPKGANFFLTRTRLACACRVARLCASMRVSPGRLCRWAVATAHGRHTRSQKAPESRTSAAGHEQGNMKPRAHFSRRLGRSLCRFASLGSFVGAVNRRNRPAHRIPATAKNVRK